MTNHPVLLAQHLSKHVSGPEGSLTLLDDINMRVEAGATVAITGPSGAGKSTLLSLLAGLDQPSQGQVSLMGQPFSELNEDGRARLRGQHCAFVFQQFQLVHDLTARENVMLPLEINGLANARQRADEWLDRVGLHQRRQHFPAQLSGGEQQRVALARAFAVSPAVLFADEPTGSLDQANGQRIADMLFTLNKDQHTALVLVTHDPQLAARCEAHYQLEMGALRGQ